MQHPRAPGSWVGGVGALNYPPPEIDADVPRGPEFLLLANRLYVAISRAQWAACLIYSPGLVDQLPNTVDGLRRLSAFIRLVEGSSTDSVAK